MANVKVTALTALTAADSAATDVLPIVDVSADATKKLAISDLHRSVPDGTLSAPGIAFQSDLNSGLYRSGTDAIALVTNGAARILIDATGNVTIPNTAIITSSEFGSGTAAAPSITFTNDTDTGIYSPGANQIAISTGGTGRLFIDSSGRVGIGTSSPNYKTQIFGGSDSQENVLFTVQSNGVSNAGNLKTTLRLANSTSGSSVHAADISAIRSTNAEALAFSVYNGGAAPLERMRIDSSGNVKIVSEHLRFNTSGKGIIFGTDGNSNRPSIIGNYTSSSDNNIVFNVTGTERMRIDSSGNVGIGTASPKMQLQTGTSGGFQATAAGELAIRYNMYYSSGDKYIGSSGKASSLVMNSNGEFIFYNTNTASTSANSAVSGLGERMRIDSSGNVLFGKASQNLATAGFQHRGDAIGLVQITRDSGEPLQLNRLTNDGKLIEFRKNTTSVVGAISIQGSDLGIEVNGSERVRIDSSGKVGIGTTSPDSLLDLEFANSRMRFEQESGSNRPVIRGTRTSDKANRAISIGGSDISFLIGSTATAALTSADERMRIDSDGRLLIGGTSTADDDHANINANGTLTIRRASSGDDCIVIKEGSTESLLIEASGNVFNYNVGSFAYTSYDNEAGVAGPYAALGSFGGEARISAGSTGSDDVPLVFRTASSGTLGERVRIDSSGRLLVGTSSFTGEASAVLEGSSAGVTTQAQLWLNRGSTPVTDNVLGQIVFGDNTAAGRNGAMIQARADDSWAANDYPSRLVFSTTADGASSPTERMRITSDGALLVNTSSTNISSNERLTVNGISTFYRASGTAVYFKRTGNDGDVTLFFRDTTGVGSISVTTTATAYNTSSDYRLKENVIPVTDGIARLQQLKPSRFNFIADPDKTVDGFLAHEVQTIVPEAITGEKDAVDDEGNPQYQGIDQSKLVPLLTAALQEAIGEIESLKARVAALEAS